MYFAAQSVVVAGRQLIGRGSIPVRAIVVSIPAARPRHLASQIPLHKISRQHPTCAVLFRSIDKPGLVATAAFHFSDRAEWTKFMREARQMYGIYLH
jgi:hypothetical protein